MKIPLRCCERDYVFRLLLLFHGCRLKGHQILEIVSDDMAE